MSLWLRKAEFADMDLLFCWANDDAVRANAFHTEMIPYENHIKWFEKMMQDASVYQYILCEDKISVGQVRLNVENGMALIDYSVSSEQRGKGYGSKMIQMMQEQLVKDKEAHVMKLVGQVKYENSASARVFEQCGFLKTELPEWIQYEKNVKGVIE